jgi:hypothetical protein
MIKTVKLLPLFFLLCSCNSCFKGFYGVHENPTPLKITFDLSETREFLLKRFIDSLNTINQQKNLLCPLDIMRLEDNDKIVCLSDTTCECYLLSFEKEKVSIRCVLLASQATKQWRCNQGELTSEERYTVESHFKKEILNKIK